MTVASFFRKYSVGCILNYVRFIITREISCQSSHNTTYNENLKLTSDTQLIVYRSLR
jgi:hypothetical protein